MAEDGFMCPFLTPMFIGILEDKGADWVVCRPQESEIAFCVPLELRQSQEGLYRLAGEAWVPAASSQFSSIRHTYRSCLKYPRHEQACAPISGVRLLIWPCQIAQGQGALSQTFLRRYNLDAMQGGWPLPLRRWRVHRHRPAPKQWERWGVRCFCLQSGRLWQQRMVQPLRGTRI